MGWPEKYRTINRPRSNWHRKNKTTETKRTKRHGPIYKRNRTHSLQHKAREYSIENPDETCDGIHNSLISKDLTFKVSIDGTVKQTKDKISSLEAQIEERTSLIRTTNLPILTQSLNTPI